MSQVRGIWRYANNVIKFARQMVNEDLQPLQLSSAEGNILLHLLTTEEILRQEDLVEELEISKPAVSRALRSLEKKGFVQRKKDPEDRRVSRICLTGKALEKGPAIEEVYENLFQQAAQDISEEEIKEFIELFKRISENFLLAREKREKEGAKNDSK
ncbi:MAG: MarR family transcriptional regulator [Firmicutes bacterium]|nr:MarR family transcriptional regulator [Bacillota bacterium]